MNSSNILLGRAGLSFRRGGWDWSEFSIVMEGTGQVFCENMWNWLEFLHGRTGLIKLSEDIVQSSFMGGWKLSNFCVGPGGIGQNVLREKQ